MTKQVKVAITGAAGQIGYALLFRIASGQMFGPETQVDLHLLELEAALPALRGVVMELEDGAFPLLNNIICTADLNEGMRDVNWAILVGAVPRKQGMERADLLKINGGIFTAQGKAMQEHAAPDVRVLVVGNPCNTNALIAMQNTTLPPSRFFAMTMLDEKRAIAQLAHKANVPVSAISDMIVWGNHSATQFPDFENAKIQGNKVSTVINDRSWLETTFMQTVQQRGAAIIKARGASSAASAANAIVSSIYNMTHDTPANESYSMCRCSEGEYGIEPGLIFSFPCRTEQGEVKVVTGIEHSEYGQEKLRVTLKELQQERDAVKAMALI